MLYVKTFNTCVLSPLKGAGTDDHTLIRVVVSRSEIDLFNIRKEFRKNFATSLYSMIKVELSYVRNPESDSGQHAGNG